jgi:hypothetical protein
MSLRIGDLTVLNVLIWKAFVQSYIEKTVSSLIFAHQRIGKWITRKTKLVQETPIDGAVQQKISKKTKIITHKSKHMRYGIFPF